jgi:hypothetical protein
MPRLAPTEIVEQRITFGNYERQFVTDVKNDIQKGVTIAAITAAAVPAWQPLQGWVYWDMVFTGE